MRIFLPSPRKNRFFQTFHIEDQRLALRGQRTLFPIFFMSSRDIPTPLVKEGARGKFLRKVGAFFPLAPFLTVCAANDKFFPFAREKLFFRAATLVLPLSKTSSFGSNFVLEQEFSLSQVMRRS